MRTSATTLARTTGEYFVGVVILFFGAAFLVSHATDRGLLPIEYRLIGLVLTSLALLAVGWRLRQTRHAYAMALQGGAVGLLYLTIFTAFRLYGLLPAFLAFALLLTVVTFSVALAVVQDAKSLAVLGTSGGFEATLGAPYDLGGKEVLAAPRSWRREVLRAVLIGAVLVLGVFALRVFRESSAASTSP